MVVITEMRDQIQTLGAIHIVIVGSSSNEIECSDNGDYSQERAKGAVFTGYWTWNLL